MATISQSGVDQMMRVANDTADRFNVSLASYVKSFCNDLGQVWGAQTAVEFANSYSEVMKEVVRVLRQNMNAFHSNLQVGVNNYNNINKGSVSLSPVNYTDATIDVSAIQAKIPGTDKEGLLENTDINALTSKCEAVIQEIQNSISSADAAIRATGAFDLDETAASSDMFRGVGRILETANSNISQQLKAKLQQTVEQYGEVKAANTKSYNDVASSGNM